MIKIDELSGNKKTPVATQKVVVEKEMGLGEMFLLPKNRPWLAVVLSMVVLTVFNFVAYTTKTTTKSNPSCLLKQECEGVGQVCSKKSYTCQDVTQSCADFSVSLNVRGYVIWVPANGDKHVFPQGRQMVEQLALYQRVWNPDPGICHAKVYLSSGQPIRAENLACSTYLGPSPGRMIDGTLGCHWDQGPPEKDAPIVEPPQPEVPPETENSPPIVEGKKKGKEYKGVWRNKVRPDPKTLPDNSGKKRRYRKITDSTSPLSGLSMLASGEKKGR